ncbi:uncharacterized protein LOC131425359 [Malaya genurostris]|nr:uncharacterized protein LOC131425359 [Malaya genurostris]
MKTPMYPLFVVINELPPKERFKKQNLILAALWISNGEPNMPLFFQNFCLEMRKLREGMFIDNILYKIVVLQCCVDSVCRCKIQNMKQFNGYFGCSLCLHPGVAIGKQVRYPYRKCQKRDHSSTKQHMMIAQDTAKELFGIKGLSVLLSLPNFDIVRGFGVDYMHASLLGVTKQMWNQIVTCDLGINRNVVEERLISIRFPSVFPRHPRKLNEVAKFKASEWECIALYCFYPCFYGLIPKINMEHFMKFSSSLFQLLETNISVETLKTCETTLVEFAQEFAHLYGTDQEVYNVHLQTHLSDVVRNLEGLWNSSLFPYESGNGMLLDLKTGHNHPVIQVTKKYCLKRFCHYTPMPINSPIKNWVYNLWEPRKLPRLRYDSRFKFVADREILDKDIVATNFSYHSKFSFKGIRYCTKLTCEKFKYDDSFIFLNNCFFQIQNILTDEFDNIYIVGQELNSERVFNNLFLYEFSSLCRIIKINNTIRQCVNMTIRQVNEILNFISICKFRTQVD